MPFQKENQCYLRHGHGRGRHKTPTYSSWIAMRYRCNSPSCPAFYNYGGRGISVCARWNDFSNFLADMGERPDGTTLDRINNDGNYEPGNCRWATRSQQRLNSRNPKRGGKLRFDLLGKRFSRLLVLSFEDRRNGNTYWKCKCDCGAITYVSRGNLVTDNVRSCGCLGSVAQAEYRAKKREARRDQLARGGVV